MRDFFVIFGLCFLLIVVILAAILFGINYWERYACGKYQDVTGRETKWVFMNDCYINTGSDWLKRHEYAAIIVAREGLKNPPAESK